MAVPVLAQAGGAPFLEDERSAIPRTPFEAKDAFAADLNQDGVPDVVLADGRIDQAFDFANARLSNTLEETFVAW